MRVALDYTPAINQIAGVGRYTRSLFAALLAEADRDVDWTLWYPRDHDGEPFLPRGEQVTGLELRISSRLTNLVWHRIGVPLRFERFAGAVSVVHGTDFVVPPSRAPSVVTVHDLSFALHPNLAFPRLRRYLSQALPRSINRATKVIAVSETTKKDICAYYEIAPHRIEVIHHAADPLFHRPSESELLGNLAQFGLRRPYFVSVGTVEPRKDYRTLLKAFERVHNERPETSLVIVGRKGWLADDIMRDIAAAADRMPVIHLQGVPDNMLPALYGGSQGLIYPSVYEGFGLPLLEAMASGTAVVASSTPALCEVAGEAALFAAPGDFEQFAAHMFTLLDDAEKRHSLIEKGSSRSAEFTWQNAARRHLDLYREVSRE